MKELLRNIIAGAGSTLEIYPPPIYFRSRILVNRNDGESLKDDWLKIGEDFKRALGKHVEEKENKTEK